MGNCKIKNCTTKKGQKTIFSVPLEPVLRSKWIAQIRRHQTFDDIPIVYPVCIDHFDDNDIRHSGKRKTLKKGSVPICFPDADGIMKVFLPQTPVIEYEGEKQSCEEVDSQPDFNPNTSSSSSPSTSTTKGRQKENQMPNTVDDGNANIFQITAHEYNRLLQAEIQLNKYKGLCEKKAKEIKNLQDLVARLKRKELKRNAETENENEESIMADVAQVNKKILV